MTDLAVPNKILAEVFNKNWEGNKLMPSQFNKYISLKQTGRIEGML